MTSPAAPPRQVTDPRCSPTRELTDAERDAMKAEHAKGRHPCPEWANPELRIGVDAIKLNGETIPGGGYETGNVLFIEPLHERLRTNRRRAVGFQPNAPFAHDLALAFGKDVGSAAILSVMHTAGRAGYSAFTVRVEGGEPLSLSWYQFVPPGPGSIPALDQEVFVEAKADGGFQVGFAGRPKSHGRSLALRRHAQPPDIAGLSAWFRDNCDERELTPCVTRLRLRVPPGPLVDSIALLRSLLAAPTLASSKPEVVLTYGCESWLELNAEQGVMPPLPWGPRSPRREGCAIQRAANLPNDSIAFDEEQPGKLPRAVIQRVVRASRGLRACHRAQPTTEGPVFLRFVVNEDGSVTNSTATGEQPDDTLLACAAQSITKLEFPKPEGGIVSVRYSFTFDAGR